MTYEQAKARGISLRAARGHGGEEAEKKPLERRRVERGAPTESERVFFRAQLRKTQEGREYDDYEEYAERAREAWANMAPGQRRAIMARQQSLASGFRARKALSRRARRRGAKASPLGFAGGGGAGGIGRAGGGDGGGAFSPPGYDFGTGRAEFNTWIDEDFPEIDDFEFLVYYH